MSSRLNHSGWAAALATSATDKDTCGDTPAGYPTTSLSKQGGADVGVNKGSRSVEKGASEI